MVWGNDGVIVWLEDVDPVVMHAREGEPPADDYSNLYFTGTGEVRAHAGRLDGPPRCLTGATKLHSAGRDWDRPLPVGTVRCEVCVLTHPVPSTGSGNGNGNGAR